jgi:sugar lactone lactonase YvrE
MSIRRPALVLLAAFIVALIAGCAGMHKKAGPEEESAVIEPIDFTGSLEVAAESQRQWTGVAVSHSGRVFVCWPRWSDDVPVSVAEIKPTGEVVPYPNEEWNTWRPGLSPAGHFVCVQSVYVDDEDYLWILDAANPNFKGAIDGGPKLIKVDLATGRVNRRYFFDEYAAPPSSYLNDVRVDTQSGYAYISDSGAGAILVVDTKNGKARRLLEFHLSTKSDGSTVNIGGKPWLRPNGSKPQVHVDGIALDPAREYLYFKALTGRTLYRVRTRLLRDVLLSYKKLGAAVEAVADVGPTDGIMFGPDGCLYITSIEDGAIKRFTPGEELETIIKDDRLVWPDSMAFGPDWSLYVTSSQINLWGKTTEPYRLFRLRP